VLGKTSKPAAPTAKRDKCDRRRTGSYELRLDLSTNILFRCCHVLYSRHHEVSIALGIEVLQEIYGMTRCAPEIEAVCCIESREKLHSEPPCSQDLFEPSLLLEEIVQQSGISQLALYTR
jgi:hypothetical protein